MKAVYAFLLCGVAFLVGRQSALAPVECSKSSPIARRLLGFDDARVQSHGGKGRGGETGRHRKGHGGKRRAGSHEKRPRFDPLPLDDTEHWRQERAALDGSAHGRCVTDQQTADFFKTNRGRFIGCAGDERRVIAALALLSPEADKVVVDVTAHVESTDVCRVPGQASSPGRGCVGVRLRLGLSHLTCLSLSPQVGANRGFTTMAVSGFQLEQKPSHPPVDTRLIAPSAVFALSDFCGLGPARGATGHCYPREDRPRLAQGRVRHDR